MSGHCEQCGETICVCADAQSRAEGANLTDVLAPLDANEENPVRLWAEIHKLRAAVAGPDGYSSWQAAATEERIRRVKAERELDAYKRGANV